MSRFVRIVVVAAAVVAVAASSATAGVQQLTRIVDDVDPGESGDLTSYCCFPVTVTYTGESRVTLVYDRSGLVVREIDSGTVMKTYTSANGSYSFHVSPAQFTYPGGASIGSQAVATFVGLQGHAPSFIPSNAGLVRIEGTVVDFDGDIQLWTSVGASRYSPSGTMRARTESDLPSAPRFRSLAGTARVRPLTRARPRMTAGPTRRLQHGASAWASVPE